jgi:TM2 domain-containing membrane protein YozV
MDYDRAVEEFQSIYFTNFNDTLYKQVCYQQSLCYFLNGEPSKALWKIDEYFHRSLDSVSFSVFMPVKLFSLNATCQWKQAFQCFREYVKLQKFSPEKEHRVLEIVNSLYSKKNLPKIRSEEAAENWSRFIPGAGQIYAGEPAEGAVNLAINSSILVFAGYQLYYHYYLTGYLVGLGLFNKIYHGGMKRAGILAVQKNKEQLINFNQKVSSLIQEQFSL